MKKIFIILLVLFGSLAVKAQSNPFPSIDSLERFINRYIRNSPVEAFQNLRMNTALQGMLRFIETGEIGAGLDTAYTLNDSTLRLITFEPDTFDVVIGGVGGTNNPNTGSGYRWLIPSTQAIKTAFSDITGTWDSTSNANGLTYKVDTSVIATLDTTFKILTRAVVVIDTIEYIHSGSSSATYTNTKLINGKLIQLTLENYPVSFITRTGIVYVSAFDDSTGEITLTNGFFADEDHVKIIYRTYAIFLVDGSGNLVTDSNGNYVIVN